MNCGMENNKNEKKTCDKIHLSKACPTRSGNNGEHKKCQNVKLFQQHQQQRQQQQQEQQQQQQQQQRQMFF